MDTELQARLRQYVERANEMEPERFEWWKPKEGESITGVVEYCGDAESSFGNQRVIKVKDADGVIYCKAMTSAIARFCDEKAVRAGDLLTIKYFGSEDLPGGKVFKNFSLFLHERAAVNETF